jgi:hypothetical protein
MHTHLTIAAIQRASKSGKLTARQRTQTYLDQIQECAREGSEINSVSIRPSGSYVRFLTCASRRRP